MPGVLKIKRDKTKWNNAKAIIRSQYPEMGETDLFIEIADSIYQKMKKSVLVNQSLLQKAIDLSFLCPDKRDKRTLAKSLYYLLDNHIENLYKSYKLQDRYKFQGLNLSIENKKGSFRHWHDPLKNEDGKTYMNYDYGYIRLTEGADGDHVDVYVGPDKNAGRVYVVHQNNPTNGKYDEDKVMLGFNSADEAKTAYLKQYDDPKFFGSIEEYNFLTFADKVFKKKGKVTGQSLVYSEKLQKSGNNFHIKLKELFTDDSGEVNIYKNRHKLKKLKGFPDQLDLENCEITSLREKHAYFEAGGDWQQGVFFGVRLKGKDLEIFDLYSGDAQQNKKELRQNVSLVLRKSKLSDQLKKEGKAKNKKRSDYNKEQIKLGIKIEMEHTKDKEVALEIAMDHLEEDPIYYTKLIEMEKSIDLVLLTKAVKIKKNYSADELKAKNMRWVTIRGNHVLLQGMSDGSYVVVGGAGGKLNHMRIDSLLSDKEYKARRKEKKEAQLTDLSSEEIKEQAQKRKEEIVQKKTARTNYETAVKDILGLTAEDIRTNISAEDMDELYADAKKKVAKKKKLDEKEVKKEDVEKEAEKLLKKKANEEIKKAEKAAMDVLADDFFGEGIEEKDTADALKDRIDADTAMEILKARKMFRKELKDINAPKRKKKNLSFNETYAQSEDFNDESVLSEVKNHIDTMQNIRMYDTLDRQSEAIQKHIDNGASEALNGIVSDVYSGGAALSSETIQALGMDACVQIIANKLYTDGNAEKTKDALIKFVQKNNTKIVKKTLKEMDERFHNADVIRGLSGKDDDPDAILSVASANGYALRQLTRGQQVLGTAVGSLRSAAHLINAIEEGQQDKVFIDMGNNLARARKNATKAGFKRGEYKMKSKPGGQKGFVMEIPKASCDKFFEKNKKIAAEETKIDRIKSHKENNGYVPDGIKEGIKLDPAQEAGLRFFIENDTVLLDFEAGLGKTAIGYAAIMEAMNSKGVKKALFVTPAKLRTQTSTDESKVFLTKENQGLVKNTDGKSMAEREAIYQEDGIHFIGHDQLRTDAKILKAAGYDMIVVDEIHEMTNQRDATKGKADSGRYRGMMSLSDIPLKIGMSGTNIKSSKKEFYKKVNFLDPNHNLGTMKEFESRYKGLNQGSNAFQDSSNDAFRKEVAKYSYTQKKKLDVKNNQEQIRMPMTPSQKKAYKTSEQTYVKEKNSLNKSVSKSAAGRRESRNYDIVHNGFGQFENSKMDSIVDTMEEKHPGEKAVIHCYRKNAIRTAVKKLEGKYGKGSVAVIDGDSSKGHVSKTKAAYNDPSSKLKFLIGTKSVEAGLNLQHGGRVTFHLDVPMDEASKDQREGRQFRRGQSQDCHSYMLVTETPFDINKVDMMERKGREMKILGNPSSVEAKDENGFLAMLNSVEKESGYGA